MKKFKSETTNWGTTIELDSVEAAIKLGRDMLEAEYVRLSELPKGTKVKASYKDRDSDKTKTKTLSQNKIVNDYKITLDRYDEAVDAIVHGCEEDKLKITQMTEALADMASELAPGLRANYAGFDRAVEGIDASPELLAAGEERCCFSRKQGSDEVKSGTGEGAYRIIINTDVYMGGDPAENAAMVSALVILLQGFRPVEVWIQQGWLGSHPNDGVTLFKLDFTAGFDPTALAFWIGHPYKDRPFSWAINKALGRQSTDTSEHAEIPCDMMMRGDWMARCGIKQYEFMNMLHTDKMDIMAKWIAGSAMEIAMPGYVRSPSGAPIDFFSDPEAFRN